MKKGWLTGLSIGMVIGVSMALLSPLYIFETLE